jgi:uncharacterized protein YcnI
MRCSGWSSLAISACSSLVVALALIAPAGAHVTARTPYLYAATSSEFQLDVPNERDAPMTGFHVSVPAGFDVVSAEPNGKWLPVVGETSVFWAGGVLRAGAQTTFQLKVDAPSTPGAASFTALQHYANGAAVDWRVPLTVLPADKPSQQFGRAIVVGLVGLLGLVAIGVLAWRRRGRPLHEP